MNAALTGFVQTCADAFPLTMGAVTYVHANEAEQSRMELIVKRSILIGAAVGSGASLGMFAVQYGVRTSLAFAITYVASHTVAIGGWIVKGGVIWSVIDVLAARQQRAAV